MRMKGFIILTATVVFWSAPAFCGQEDDAAAPTAVFSPNPMNFGFLTPGDTKVLTLTVTNTGSADLVIKGDHLYGDHAIFFRGPDNCKGASVPPGGTCQVQIQFSPTNVWAKPMYAYFAIFDNATNGYQYVLMYGWDNPQLK